MNETTQFCPLFSNANAGNGRVRCAGENCAWYDIVHNDCAVVRISEEAEAIGAGIYFARKEGAE